MTDLPDAVVQNPACGCCGSETCCEVGEYFYCEDCELSFDYLTFEASYLDPDITPCGAQCDNSWHGDNKIKPGLGFDCNPCQLPSGHKSMHWTGCQPKPVPEEQP